MAGVAGSTGPAGPAGVQGAAGPTGAQGPAGVVERWTSFRDFWFAFDRAEIQPSETSKVSEIAAYMKQNPSLHIGIDGSMDPRGTDPRNQGLSDRRVNAIRDALIQAGVPAHKIQAGAFGDTRLTRDRRVEVLISTGN
jgi:outer membrane protein OmpA-like peptidoglycan-associated protein